MRCWWLLGLCVLAIGAADARKKHQVPSRDRASSPSSYRFDMTQHGKRMTAADFAAWMKARGIRVAKGAPRRK